MGRTTTPGPPGPRPPTRRPDPDPPPAPNTTVTRTRAAGPFAVALLWLTIGAAVALTGFDLRGDRPLSELANLGPGGWLFPMGLGTAALLFIAFHGHVRTRFPVTTTFSVLMLVGMAGQLVAAIVPIGDGPGGTVHVTSALVLAAAIPLFLVAFARSQTPGRWRRAAWLLAVGDLAACLGGVALSRAGEAPLAEIIPAAAFHLWVLVVAARPDPEPVDEAAAPPAVGVGVSA